MKYIKRSFVDLKSIVSEETVFNYQDWKIHFKIHTDAYDKQLGAVISQNNKPIEFSAREFQNHN